MSNFQLPNECWESIFKFLLNQVPLSILGTFSESNTYASETLSLVSKHFLSLSNNLVSSLKITDQTLPYLPRLLTRFPMLKSLNLCHFNGDLHALLRQISLSSLSLNSLELCIQKTFPSDGFRALAKKMKTLKSLSCRNLRDSVITMDHLLLIVECFPALEELDIACYRYRDSNNAIAPVSDVEIKALSLGLPKLRKVKLSGDYLINDSLFFDLCKNCCFLEQVVLTCCEMISQDGIASAIKERPNLSSFSLRIPEKQNISSDLIASLVCSKQLTCLDFSFSKISDELLFSLAKAGPPLRKLFLQGCSDYSYDGIYCLLSKCQLVQHLDLYHGAEFLEDKHIKELSMFLGHLTNIDLSGCYQLTYLSFFALVMNCPLLSEITMEETYLGEFEENEVLHSLMDSLTDTDIIVNFQVKSLRLSSNKRLMDDNIEIFAKICPNLEILDLSTCRRISNGAVEVLKRCPKIRYLSLFSHTEIELFGMINFQFPNLEVLRLSYSEIDDESLIIISKSCPGLLNLEMINCPVITAKGVKQVVKRCKQLREIDLSSCRGVATSVVAWMVSSRPSLRRIYAPPHFRLSESKKELFLRRGCLVEVCHLPELSDFEM